MSKSSPAISTAEHLARWDASSGQRVAGAGPELLERSQRIVDAAYDLLEEDGLDGLTIRAVLRKTGLSRRAFYESFEGKDDLLVAVFEGAIRKAAQQLSALTRKMGDPMERLRWIIHVIVVGKDTAATNAHRGRRSAALSREHLRLAESRPGDLTAALQPLMTLLEQHLAEGMAMGVVRKDNPQRLASLLYNLVSTTVHRELLTQESVRDDRAARVQLANDVWEFCRRALEA